MVVIASRHIFGGGPYSVAGSSQLKFVGRKKWPVSEITIGRPGPGRRDRGGVYRPGWVAPFMPKKITEPYHPGGNSVCYMIQTAHLMGCDPIYLLGFTLLPGSGYFFGSSNPVTRVRSVYDTDRALDWLRWYQERYPSRVKLWPGWQGPIYEALEVLDDEQAKALSGTQSRHQPDTEGVDVQGVE